MPPTEISTTRASGPAEQANVIAQLAREGVARYRREMSGSTELLIWPEGRVLDLESTYRQPSRKRGSAALLTPDSFIAYVKTHATAGTTLTGTVTEKAGSFTALLDYHHASQPNPHDDTAGWAEHTASLALAATPEWARWLAKSGTDLDQKTFAEFLEDNAPDITVPEGLEARQSEKFPSQQELVSLALTLQVKTDVQFGNQIRLQNGEQQLTYRENIEGSWGGDNKLAIPAKFALAIAPFAGTPKYLVTARLRYRAAGGKASFRYEIERPHKIVEDAFNDVKQKIEAETERRVLVGTITPYERKLRSLT
jgi:uncharacterized protein YfdQ (DUF2303 family)